MTKFGNLKTSRTKDFFDSMKSSSLSKLKFTALKNKRILQFFVIDEHNKTRRMASTIQLRSTKMLISKAKKFIFLSKDVLDK